MLVPGVKIQDWQSAARLVLLKARHDYLTGGKSPILKSILNEVLQAVPQTMDWWDDSEILPIGDTSNILVSKDRPGLRIAFYDEKM